MLEYWFGCQEKARAPEIKQRIFELAILGRQLFLDAQHRAECLEIGDLLLEVGDADADIPQIAVHALTSGAIPSAMAVAIGFPTGLCHGKRIFQLHESAVWMGHGRFNRDHHAAGQWQVSIITLIMLWRVRREPRRFMAHEPHAVGHEVKAGLVGG